ncbi:hypothetical protein GCM10010124_40530 [Pilimelia terevasa]|uniref:Uncharacterized protein n=1 Tax=Pilimelia terevasa TaxID=53372 RepID=A0A8J3FJX0_9ACTN|nr:hypothetical protein GCM10010124_40530 [Pilimelia terevasa]
MRRHSSRAAGSAVINTGFSGTRTVYNIIDTRLPCQAEAVRAVGFATTGPG